MQANALASNSRFFWVDLLKVSAALIIVGHHVSAYAPFSPEIEPVLEGLHVWLYDYGRMAVSIFLVIGGFLAGQSILEKRQAGFSSIWKRYRRLMPLYLVAIALTLIASAFVRPGYQADWLPGTPNFGQLLAHGLLLQDVLGVEALFAGAWYVAIDFQLYSLLVLGWWACRQLGFGEPGFAALVFALAASSLFVFNRNASLDWSAVYFMAAYGLGVFAGIANRGRGYAIAFVVLGILSTLGLMLEFRPRLLLAMLTALVLFAVSFQKSGGKNFASLTALSEGSYAVFLLHFSVIVLTSALWAHSGLQGPLAAIFFVLSTLALSVILGLFAHRLIAPRL